MLKNRWGESFKLGHEELDLARIHFLADIDAIHGQFHELSVVELRGKLADLLNSASSIFPAEENLMQHQQYEEYSLHKEEHDLLISTIENFLKVDSASEKEIMYMNLLAFIQQWFFEHSDKDVRYQKFLKNMNYE